MFRRVLVAIDGSTTSMRGLQAAINLAGDQQAELNVMHVYFKRVLPEKLAGETYVPAQLLDVPLVSGREAGRRILEEAVTRADENALSVNPLLIASRGLSVAYHILRQARKLKADVIVMGTHGHHGLRRLVMGSDAESVVREATVPVLLIRSEEVQRKLSGPRLKTGAPKSPRAKPAASGRGRRVDSGRVVAG